MNYLKEFFDQKQKEIFRKLLIIEEFLVLNEYFLNLFSKKKGLLLNWKLQLLSQQYDKKEVLKFFSVFKLLVKERFLQVQNFLLSRFSLNSFKFLEFKNSKKILLHPITFLIKILEDFFKQEGYFFLETKEIVDIKSNFFFLNITKNHPSFSKKETFFLKNNSFCLRTHTTVSDIKFLERFKLEYEKKRMYKMFSYGKVYRKDYDSNHTPMFHQLDILSLEKKITFFKFKQKIVKLLSGIFSYFQENFFYRIRSTYFPFTEPSFEFDIYCCNEKKCLICKGNKWIEVLGAGFLKQNILRRFKIGGVSAIAMGMGLERILSLLLNKFFRVKIDLRSFYY